MGEQFFFKLPRAGGPCHNVVLEVANVPLGYRTAIFVGRMLAAKGLAPGKQREIFRAHMFSAGSFKKMALDSSLQVS